MTNLAVVENLQKLWKKKKEAFEYTQVQAAKELGWTQGAFSQYLNNLTELNDAAIIKLANFLDVDPNQIDPEFNERSAIRWTALPKATTLTGLHEAPSGNKFFDNELLRNAQLVYCDVDLPPIAVQGSYLAVIHEKYLTMQSRISNMAHDLWGIYQESYGKDAPWSVAPYVDIPPEVDTAQKRIVVSTLWV